jgi:hypothetical protein
LGRQLKALPTQKNFAFVDKPVDWNEAATENATSQVLAKYILIALESEKERGAAIVVPI